MGDRAIMMYSLMIVKTGIHPCRFVGISKLAGRFPLEPQDNLLVYVCLPILRVEMVGITYDHQSDSNWIFRIERSSFPSVTTRGYPGFASGRASNRFLYCRVGE